MEQQPLSRERLTELVQQFDTAMLVTKTEGDSLRARPMAIADVDDEAVWFISRRASGQVQEIGDRDVVSITMQGSMVFVALVATARPTDDRARIGELWRESWGVWFPDGPQSAELVLIRAELTEGEFWDNRGGAGVTFRWDSRQEYGTGELDDTELSESRRGRMESQPSGADDGP